MTQSQPDKSLSPLKRREAEIAASNFNKPAHQFLSSADRPEPPTPERIFRVLLVGSDEVALGLSRFCDVVRPAPDGVASLREAQPFDLALVELTFDYGEQAAWRPLLTGPSASPGRVGELAVLSKGLALWHTLTAGSVEAFRPILASSDLAFFADEAAARLSPSARSATLPVAYDPVRHNPWRNKFPNNFAASLPMVFDAPFRDLMFSREAEALGETLSRFLGYRAWGFEHAMTVRPRDEYLPLHVWRRYVGELDDSGRSTALALARFAVELSAPSGADPIVKSRHCLEAIGAKAIPLCNFAPALGPDAGRLHLPIDDRLFALLDDYPNRYWAFEEFAHVGHRTALTRHSYRARFADLVEAIPELTAHPDVIARAAALRRAPSASMIVPTMRPWLAPFVYRMFLDQTVADKELIFCFHGDDFDFRAAHPAIAGDERVSWRHVPARCTIGACLNAGIEAARGDYWAKIDDDDYYGPNYLADMLMMRNYAEFDIAGKSHIFAYDEEPNLLTSRRNPIVVHGPRDIFAGGTLVGRRGAGEMRFSERLKGFADMEFLWRHFEEGARLLAGDPYNFIQIRRANKSGHTWRADTEEFPFVTPVCEGPGLSRVAI